MKVNELKVIYDKMFLPIIAIDKVIDVPKKEYNGGYKADEVYSLLEYLYNPKYQIEENAYIVAFYDNNLIGTYHLSKGTDANCYMDAKAIFRFLLLVGANRFTIAHNHPNCTDEMSAADYEITKKLWQLGSDFDIQMINHIIIGKDSWKCIDNVVLQKQLFT